MIDSVLVANRGVIASRVFRSARRLGLRTVAVYSDADRGEPYVDEADCAVALPGIRAEDTYLNIDAVVAACRTTGAAALQAGYGLLAENPRLVTACGDAGVVFVGPPAEAVEAMGSKLNAKQLAAAAGVPVLPSITIEADDEWFGAVAELQVPLLVKPSAGGGGKGMLRVDDRSQLRDAVDSARRQAAGAFGDATLMVERFITVGRHVEVQIAADRCGNVVHLGERECSIQRRHQKVIEESPSPAVDADLRARMTSAAVALAKSIDYENVGTVEFLLEPSGDFWFLEVNTRLQVEHAVTEERTGIDLVELQLAIAEGRLLPFDQDDVVFRGHAIQARLYAEDPAAGFLPAPGDIVTTSFGAGPGIRVEAGVADGSSVGAHYDPMLAKLVAWGPDRATATARLSRALADTAVHGITTNRDFLVATLGTRAFAAGETTTSFVADHPELVAPSSPELVRFLAIAAALADAHDRRVHPTLPLLSPGWRNVRTDPPAVLLRTRTATVPVALRAEGDVWRVSADGRESVARYGRTRDSRVTVEIDGVRRACSIERLETGWSVHTHDGSEVFHDFDAGAESGPAQETGATSPMPGTVTLVPVAVGQRVDEGDVLAVVEAMKMEHRLLAQAPGVVTEVRAAPGVAVAAHEVLVVVDDHPTEQGSNQP
jgi:acetyl/propionyl-CoA carboxylase alpha subunit